MTLPKIVPDTCKHSGVLLLLAFMLYTMWRSVVAMVARICLTHGRFTFFCVVFTFISENECRVCVCVCAKRYMTIIFDIFVRGCMSVALGREEVKKSTKRKIIFILWTILLIHTSWEMERKNVSPFMYIMNTNKQQRALYCCSACVFVCVCSWRSCAGKGRTYKRGTW